MRIAWSSRRSSPTSRSGPTHALLEERPRSCEVAGLVEGRGVLELPRGRNPPMDRPARGGGGRLPRSARTRCSRRIHAGAPVAGRMSRSGEGLRPGRPRVGSWGPVRADVRGAAMPSAKWLRRHQNSQMAPAHPQGRLCLAGSLQPVEGGAEVVVLALESVEPLRGAFRRRCGSASSASARKCSAWRRRSSSASPRLLEPLGRELADRLEHPEALVACGARGSCRRATGARRGRRRRPPRPPRACSRRAKTASRANSRCSSSSSRSYDHSIVARSVCWRGSASRPPLSRSSRSDSRSRICAGESTLVRAAASSSASGRLSSARQSSATRRRRARRRARAQKSSTPSSARAAGPGTRPRR